MNEPLSNVGNEKKTQQRRVLTGSFVNNKDCLFISLEVLNLLDECHKKSKVSSSYKKDMTSQIAKWCIMGGSFNLNSLKRTLKAVLLER